MVSYESESPVDEETKIKCKHIYGYYSLSDMTINTIKKKDMSYFDEDIYDEALDTVINEFCPKCGTNLKNKKTYKNLMAIYLGDKK